MPKQIPIVGGYYKDPDRHWSRQDCLNWIPVKAERPGALTEWILRDAPGLKPYMQITDDTGGIRGARNVEGKLFLTWRSTLYQISNTGVAIPRGTIPGIGRVSMAHNAKGLGNELLTVNGSAGYVYNTQTLAFGKVTDTGYPGAFVADFVDQYLPQVEPQGRYWFHSDLANAHAYNTLDQYQAEGDPDRIVSLLVSHREVLVFGADTIEPYVNTGDTTGTFQRASNTVIECGCAARFTPRRLDSSAFWLDDQRLVRRLDGYTPTILSTEAIAGAFAECTEAEIGQAYAFTWEGAGHKVYYITVPNRFTFGYDAKTGEWHRRASFGLPHWAVSEIVFWNGKWYACDSRRPRLFELDSSYKRDGADPLVRERSAQVIWADQNEITLDELELMFGTPSADTGEVQFPEQPAGPQIEGDAPDATLGAAYSFAYTVTPGDAAIDRTIIVSGSLPTGLSWDESTATISGSPTTPGSFSIRLRTIDLNGLWDELPDTIDVTVTTMAIGATALSTYRVASSADGDTWAQMPGYPTVFTLGLLIPVSASRFVAFNDDGSKISYTDNFGNTFTDSTGTMPGGAAPGSCARGGVVLIGGTTGERFARSTDSGASFSAVAATGYWPAQMTFVTDDEVIAYENKETRYMHSADKGATWSVLAVSGIVIMGRQMCFAHGGKAVFGGKTPGLGSKPAIAITESGASDTVVTLEGSAGSFISAMCTNGSEDAPLWVVGTDAGELYWSDDLGGTWHKSTYTVPGSTLINALCWNGALFILGASVGAVDSGIMATSALGKDSWNVVSQPLTYNIYDIKCLPLGVA